ncbi:hypothetical protein AVEN_178586-1, partial [Araneus ventricosus]
MKLALIQCAVSPIKEKNLERACALIKEAAQNGANLVCLPALFVSKSRDWHFWIVLLRKGLTGN